MTVLTHERPLNRGAFLNSGAGFEPATFGL